MVKNQRILQNNQLSALQLQQLHELAALCQTTDGGVPCLYPHLLKEKRETDNNLLYYKNNQLIGFLSVYFFYADACEISLMVHPDYRQQKIATQLLQPIF